MLTKTELDEIYDYQRSLFKIVEPRDNHPEDVRVCKIVKQHLGLAEELIHAAIFENKGVQIQEGIDKAQKLSKFTVVVDDYNVLSKTPTNENVLNTTSESEFSKIIESAFDRGVREALKYITPNLLGILTPRNLNLKTWLQYKKDVNLRAKVLNVELCECVMATLFSSIQFLNDVVVARKRKLKKYNINVMSVKTFRKNIIKLDNWMGLNREMFDCYREYVFDLEKNS